MKRKASGQSLTEAMIALVILGISILGIVTYISGENKSSQTVKKMHSCRVFADAIVNDFSDNSSMRIVNYIPGSVDATGNPQLRNPALPVSRLETAYFDSTAQISGNFQNLENGMTRAYQAFEKDRAGYCGGFKEIQAGVNDAILNTPSTITTINNNGYKVYVQIIPWVFKSATYTNPISDCLASYDFHPINVSTSTENIGVQLKVKVANASGTQSCSAEKILTYTTDTNPPSMTTPASVSCDATGVASIPITTNEPGSLLVCRYVPGSFDYCQNLTQEAAEAYALNVGNPGISQGPLTATLKVTNLNAAYNTHQISIETIDTAGNVSATSTVTVSCP